MSRIEEAIRLRAIIEDAVSQALTDENALSAITLFPSWNGNGVTYPADSRIKYEGKLFRCVQEHVSQPDWAPLSTPALWARMDNPDEEYPQWVQPLGAHDAYPLGAKTSHNGKRWVNDIDNNVYEPGVFGWTEVA